MTDYTYPSIFFSYFLFFLLAVGAASFFFRSLKDDPDDFNPESTGAHAPRRP